MINIRPEMSLSDKKSAESCHSVISGLSLSDKSKRSDQDKRAVPLFSLLSLRRPEVDSSRTPEVAPNGWRGTALHDLVRSRSDEGARTTDARPARTRGDRR